MKTANTTLELELRKELAEALITDAKNMKNKGDKNLFNLTKGLITLTVSTCLLFASISFISDLAKNTKAVNDINKSTITKNIKA